MTQFAQINIASMRYDRDDPRMAGFMDNIELVNRIADAAPGFVWRLQDESGDATGIQLFDDPLTLSNMSVWETKPDLANFIYKTIHKQFIVKGSDWFRAHSRPHFACWPIADGTIPTPAQGAAKLEQLWKEGPGEDLHDINWLRNTD